MRILFRSLPAFGHLYPLMPLAMAARAAGHDVVFSTAGEFVGRLEALGFPVFPAGTTIEQSRFNRFGVNPPATAANGETNWDVLGELFTKAAIDTADDLLTLMPEIDPDLVIYEQADMGAAVAAAAFGVPAVCQAIVRALPPSIHEPFAAIPARTLRSRYLVSRTIDLAEPALVLDPYLPSLQLPAARTAAHRIPMRPVPFREPSATIPSWVGTQSGALVYVTVGTVPGYFGSLRTVIDGLAELDDVDVLVATGALDPAALGPLPPRVHAEQFVDYVALLPHIDLIVHHGGCGTTTGAWAHGVPQLVWPHGADHYMNAEAVTAGGSGIAVESPTPELVAKFAATLLADVAYGESARRIGDEIAAMPLPADVLPQVSNWLPRDECAAGMRLGGVDRTNAPTNPALQGAGEIVLKAAPHPGLRTQVGGVLTDDVRGR